MSDLSYLRLIEIERHMARTAGRAPAPLLGAPAAPALRPRRPRTRAGSPAAGPAGRRAALHAAVLHLPALLRLPRA